MTISRNDIITLQLIDGRLRTNNKNTQKEQPSHFLREFTIKPQMTLMKMKKKDASSLYCIL